MALVSAAKYGYNKELYAALVKGDGGRVIELCRRVPDGPMHILSVHNDTVLHMATYSKQKDLVLELLRELPECHLNKLTCQNDTGNTILHEAATSDRIVPAAMEMLRRAPKLLGLRNKRGETALFRAARYGKADMFQYLDSEVNKIYGNEGREEVRKAFYQRDDKTTVLHMTILTEFFDLGLLIAKKYEYLVHAQDEDRMTPLQILACNPSAFESGTKLKYFNRFFYSRVSTKDPIVIKEDQRRCRVPLWEAIRNRKERYESALRLAKFLIERDTSWEASESAVDRSKPKTHKYGGPSAASQSKQAGEAQKASTSQEASHMEIAETPLFLATKSGILEIVEEILTLYPQAVEHVDDEGRNILHVAIKYRQIHIFEFVAKMEIPMMRLVRKTDNIGNSILHMVGIKGEVHATEEMRSPAMLLHEDLLLFERVEKVTSAHFIKHFNSNGQTAEKLFAINSDKLRTDAKEWFKRTAENCSIVAVLIATVAFAAAYTIPGGPNQSTGYPILLNQPFFVVFTMTDVLSLTFALTSVIVFLSILTSPFRLRDFKQSLPQQLMLGVTLLILSVSMMMMSFAATVILMIRNNEQWTKIALYSVAFFPVCIFAVSYLPLYISLMKTFKYFLKKIGDAFPRCSIVKSKATISTYPYAPQTTHYFV